MARRNFDRRIFARCGCAFRRSLHQSRRFHMMQFRIRITRAPGRPFRRRAGRKNRLFVLDFQVGNFLLDLRLELVRGALEFIQCLAHLPGDLRQLLGPKDDERQKEKEDRLGKTHAPSYCPPGKAAIRAVTSHRHGISMSLTALPHKFLKSAPAAAMLPAPPIARPKALCS